MTRDEPFTDADRIDLILSPLLRQRRPIADVARDAAPSRPTYRERIGG